MTTHTPSMIGTDRESLVVLRPRDIAVRDWHPVPGCPGVDYTELWRRGDFVHSLVRYQPESRTPGRPHMAAYHHLWIISGTAAVAGRYVTAGSYLVVPPGVAHTVSDVGADGCLMLQVHRPMDGFEAGGKHAA
jgi:hypothetical protein